ncbi:hypothetical protein ABZT06_46325 [Streptomyces sp. NPDC005483]|uniref:hypothetical protein n=1 Tax=Streptomyces sp. NPDC005483 TaxID=3154882 RepID=UPI0033AF50BC
MQTGHGRSVLGVVHLEGEGRPTAEVLVVGLGNAEQFGDHPDRQRRGERLHQVELTGRRQGLEEFLRDLGDARLQFGGPFGEKAPETSLRNRVCSGGSASSIWPPNPVPRFVPQKARRLQHPRGRPGVLEQRRVGQCLAGEIVVDDDP